MIQVFRPALGEEEYEAVKEVMKSGWIGLGPKTREFEEKFSEYVGAKYAIGLNSGTAALHLALVAYNLAPGDEIIVPSLTFISTVHAIRYVGATPVFADVHEDTLCIDMSDVLRKITPRTRAVMPVHYGGHPCDLDELHEIADSKGILVIEDAAHAAGALYKGRRIGSISPATCFSFHAVKNLTMGEGGAIATDDARVNARVRMLRWVGINKDTWTRSSDLRTYGWYYEVEELGYKYHLSDIPAAIGIVQLQKLDRTNAKRAEIVKRYNRALSELPWISTPVKRAYVQSAYHNYVIKTDYRDQLNLYLREKGIATGVHYMPAHLHPIYKGVPATVPKTDILWRKLLTLPLYPDLTDDDMNYIIETIRSFVP
jgi:perosamine synthetase